MKIYKFYSSWYDKHERVEELEKLGVDAYGKIPKKYRSESYDYLIDDIPSQSIRIDRLHIWKNLPHQGNQWIFKAMNSNGFMEFSIHDFVSDYPETIEEVNYLPSDLPHDFYIVMLLIVFNGKFNKIEKLIKKLGFYK